MADLQNTVRHLKIILFSLFFLLIIRASIWRPYDKNLTKPCYCQTPLTLRFHLVFWCLSSNRHFGTLTLKFLLNRITKEMITNLQNTVKRLGIIVVRKCFAADHQSDILELLLLNSRRTPLWRKRLSICKILSHASKSSFSFSYLVLTAWATLCSC